MSSERLFPLGQRRAGTRTLLLSWQRLGSRGAQRWCRAGGAGESSHQARPARRGLCMGWRYVPCSDLGHLALV